MRPGSLSLFALAFVAATSLGALSGCSSEDTGLSVGVACDTFCDRFVECTVDNPVDEDNVYSACMTTCEDTVAMVESANPDDKDCEQAYREYTRCLGAEAECAEFENNMYSDQTCRSELFDIAEFCENT